MSGDTRTLTVRILGDPAGAKKALNEVEDAAGKTGDAFTKIAKLAGGLGLAAIGGGVVSFAKDAIQAGEDARKLNEQTAAAIKSTGGAANISAQQVGDLAGKISAATGIQDDNIQSGENMLLTFTNLKNGVGKGNDVFSQATQTLTDMTVALGSNPQQQAVQLGKALNDPIMGISALSKVGVTFTADQKTMIAGMVQSGDTMGAQKVILSELNKEFGGSAEAQATPIKKLSAIWGQFQETVGTALIPIIDKLATWLGTNLPRAIALTQSAFHTIKPVLDAVKAVLSGVFTLLSEHAGTVKAVAIAVGILAAAMGAWRLITIATSLVQSAFLVVTNLGTIAVGAQGIAWGELTAVQKIAMLATKVWTGIQIAFNAVLDANPIALIVLGIAALAAGIIYAYQHSDTFRSVVDKAFKTVSKSADYMWNDVLKPAFKAIVSTFISVAGEILHTASHAFGWVPGIGGKLKNAAAAFDKFSADVNNSLNGIKDKAVTVSIATVQTIKVVSSVVSDSTEANLRNTKNMQVPDYTNMATGQGGLDPNTLANLVPTDRQAAAGAAALKKSSAYKKLTTGGGSGGGGGGGGGGSAPNTPSKAEMMAKVMAESLVKGLESRYKKVQDSTDKLKALVADKKKALQDALQAEKDYAKGIADAAKANSLSNIKGDTADDGTVAAVNQGNVKAGLAAKLANLQTFLSAVRQLGGLHLNKSLMGQIFAMGPDAGLPYAQAILAGGQAAVNDDNQLQDAIDASANSLGAYAGSDQYGDAKGRMEARQTIQKLEVNIAGNVTSEKDLAKTIATTVREELAKEAKRNGKKP
jgi:hypothetical protein